MLILVSKTLATAMFNPTENGLFQFPIFVSVGDVYSKLQATKKALYTVPLTHTPILRPFSGTTQVSRYRTRKVKPIWILLKQEAVSGSGISWAICKSAPCSRQITMPAPHHSVFTGRMPFVPPNEQCQSTEGTVPLKQQNKPVAMPHLIP